MGFASLYPSYGLRSLVPAPGEQCSTENRMSGIERQDIIVLACLAAVFCWTYVVLPLVFFPR